MDLEDFVHARFDIFRNAMHQYLTLFENSTISALPRTPLRSNYSSSHSFKVAVRQYELEATWFKRIVVAITDLVRDFGNIVEFHVEQVYLLILDIFQFAMGVIATCRKGIDDVARLVELLKSA